MLACTLVLLSGNGLSSVVLLLLNVIKDIERAIAKKKSSDEYREAT
jgi:hypothetical protein